MLESSLLLLIVFAPLVSSLLLAIIPGLKPSFVKSAGLVMSVFILACLSYLYLTYHSQSEILAFKVDYPWIKQFNIHIKLAVDGISLSMMFLTSLLSLISILCSLNSIKDKSFYILLLLIETGMLGTFAAFDLFLFYIFWELTIIPMYFIIGIWGGPNRIYACIKFIIYTIAGSLLMLVGIIYIALSGNTFDITQLKGLSLSTTEENILFLLFFIAFAVKVPLFPFHTWLPDAHVEAPTAGSVLLAGVLLKMGTYGFLRIAVPFFPQAVEVFTPFIMILSVVGVIYGAMMAMAQGDIKKLVAYSSISHMGLVVLGIFSLNLISVQGATLEMVNHGLSTGALFLLVGIIYERTHRRGVNDFGGLASKMPGYATIFMIIALSSIGLPGLNGFVSEIMILLGSFQGSYKLAPVFACIAAFGIVLSAIYMLRLYRNVFFGKITVSQYEELNDITTLEGLYLLPIVCLVMLLGVFPNIILYVTQKAVEFII